MKAFQWCGRTVEFADGETVAAALLRADIRVIPAVSDTGVAGRVFCGIGACQCCLVTIDGIIREACLTPADAGMRVESVERSDAGL